MTLWKWKLSRYWNRLAYRVMDLGRWMIWDESKRNSDILREPYDYWTRKIMTGIPDDNR